MTFKDFLKPLWDTYQREDVFHGINENMVREAIWVPLTLTMARLHDLKKTDDFLDQTNTQLFYCTLGVLAYVLVQFAYYSRQARKRGYDPKQTYQWASARLHKANSIPAAIGALGAIWPYNLGSHLVGRYCAGNQCVNDAFSSVFLSALATGFFEQIAQNFFIHLVRDVFEFFSPRLKKGVPEFEVLESESSALSASSKSASGSVVRVGIGFSEEPVDIEIDITDKADDTSPFSFSRLLWYLFTLLVFDSVFSPRSIASSYPGALWNIVAMGFSEAFDIRPIDYIDESSAWFWLQIIFITMMTTITVATCNVLVASSGEKLAKVNTETANFFKRCLPCCGTSKNNASKTLDLANH